MRGSGFIRVDSDQGVAVAALVDERQLELEWCAPVALTDDAPAWCEDGGHQRGEVRCPSLRLAVWRVEEDQIVGGATGVCVAQYPPGVVAYHLRVHAQGVQIGPDGVHGGPRVVAQQRAARPARERLDPQRARAREEVEHALAVQRAEDGEQRLADAIGRRAGVGAGWRGEPPASVRAGDDPHAAIGLASTRSSASASRAYSGSWRRLSSS